MRVAFGGLAWLSLLASATVLCYPAVRGHLSCVARVNPAMARLGKPTVLVDIDGTVPDGNPMVGTPISRLGVYRRHGGESWTSS
jgi:hypothetical protein